MACNVYLESKFRWSLSFHPRHKLIASPEESVFEDTK